MGIRNTLEDLNNHLFCQLERLGDEEIKGEKLQEEITRAKAISDIAAKIINNGSLVLKAQEFLYEHIPMSSKENKKKFPRQLRAEFLGE